MKVKNLDNLIERVKTHFREYLEMHDTVFTGSHFTCPNRAEHSNDDGKPSAAFFPGPDSFKCFTCESCGDIFTAAEYLICSFLWQFLQSVCKSSSNSIPRLS